MSDREKLHPDILKIESGLDKIFNRVIRLSTERNANISIDPSFDEEIEAEIVKHLFVRVSGYLEQSLKLIIKSYAEQQKSPALLNYFLETEYRGNKDISRNANASYIRELFKKLKINFPESSNELLNRVDEALQKRHEIAHKGETSAILGLRDAQKYYDQAKNLILIISAIYN